MYVSGMTVQYVDLWVMLRDINDHCLKTGDQVISADDPMARLIGFETTAGQNQRWVIPLTNTKNGAQGCEAAGFTLAQADGILGSLKSAEGRRKLAFALSATRWPKGQAGGSVTDGRKAVCEKHGLAYVMSSGCPYC